MKPRCEVCKKAAAYKQWTKIMGTKYFCSLDCYRKYDDHSYTALSVERIDGKRIASIGEP